MIESYLFSNRIEIYRLTKIPRSFNLPLKASYFLICPWEGSLIFVGIGGFILPLRADFHLVQALA